MNISIGNVDPFNMAEPIREISESENLSIGFRGFRIEDLDSDVLVLHEALECIEGADLVIVRCTMSPDRYACYGRLCSAFDRCAGYVLVNSQNSDVLEMNRHFFKGNDVDFHKLVEFLSNRDQNNEIGIIYWILDRLALVKGKVPEVTVQRSDGIYHPDYPRDVAIDEYLSKLDCSKVTVGLMFVSSHWIYHNTGYIDEIIRRAESMGMNIIPVFFNASSTNSLSDKSTGELLRRYFTADGRPVIDVLIMNTPFSQCLNSRDPGMNIYRQVLDVPVIQAMMISGHLTDYEEMKKPGYRKEFGFQSAWAENDGQIISVPVFETVTDRSGRKRNVPITDRIDHILRLAHSWGKLRHTPVNRRKVALILYQSRPDLGAIGSAAGLDGPESAVRVLRRLRDEGYATGKVPATGKELISLLLEGITNNLDWTDAESVRKDSVALMSEKEYLRYYTEVPEFDKTQMEEKWGKPVGDVMTDGSKIIIPGRCFGNVLVTLQPLRAWMDRADTAIHDPELLMTHQYLGFYRWVQFSFGADAVIHLGTHGTVEWLPGKCSALSAKCCPDIVLNALPNIYPFQIDDPGEGIQAKRRSEAVLVGYNCMPLIRSGTYGDYGELDSKVQEYLKSFGTISAERRDILLNEILDLCKKTSYLEDLGLSSEIDPESLAQCIPELNDLIHEMGSELIRDGLHILGEVPHGDSLCAYVSACMSVRHCNQGSLTEIIAGSGCSTDPTGQASLLLSQMSELNFDPTHCRELVEMEYPHCGEILSLTEYVCKDLVPRIRQNTAEIDSIIDALDGRYVMPGPSGAPTRTGGSILPSGRNYYGMDPTSVPSSSAWEIGRRNADQMLERYRDDHGELPRNIALILWATDTFKTNGDDVAYALWLMGVRPTWNNGEVTGTEVIPLSELRRPRIDVSIRITGLFRDTFPNLITLLDDAVRTVAALDEDDESNCIRADIRKEVAEYMAKGIREDEALQQASFRIFGNAPGTYGPGINKNIQGSDWKDRSDLARTYSDWGAFAYGKDVDGVRSEDLFRRRFGYTDAIVKNLPDKEIGLVDMDDVYGYLGGLTALAADCGNGKVSRYIGDTSDTGATKVRSDREAMALVFRSRITNPRFIKGLMRHGYAGVNEVSKMTEYVFGWSASSDNVEKWMFDGLAEKYLFDEQVYQWMKDENPYALSNTMKRLFEAIERGLWDADDAMKSRLSELYGDLEERIEELSDR